MKTKYYKQKSIWDIYNNKIFNKSVKILIKEYWDGLNKSQNLRTHSI